MVCIVSRDWHLQDGVFTWNNQIFSAEPGKENTWSASLECWEGIVITAVPKVFAV